MPTDPLLPSGFFDTPVLGFSSLGPSCQHRGVQFLLKREAERRGVEERRAVIGAPVHELNHQFPVSGFRLFCMRRP
ncbi:uncharacterized [Tachysurus ichikawai]